MKLFDGRQAGLNGLRKVYWQTFKLCIVPNWERNQNTFENAR